MTPLDDELRSALAARASAVAPSPDPLGGIEARARGIRRRRGLASVAGAALAVAAVAVAVPALSPGTRTGTPATSPSAVLEQPTPTTAPQRPANLLDWPARGEAAKSPSVSALLTAFAHERGGSAEGAGYHALYSDMTGNGIRFTVGQAWIAGDPQATTVTYVEPPVAEPALTIESEASSASVAVVGLVHRDPGDLLVVVPRPGTGQVSYDDDATGTFRPVDMPGSRDGVALVDRPIGTTSDRLELLDGDGDLDHPLYRGPVAPLLTP